MSKALCDDVIHKAFDRFLRVGLDCHAMLAMTHGARSYLLTVKGLDSRNFGLLFDIDFSDTAFNYVLKKPSYLL